MLRSPRRHLSPLNFGLGVLAVGGVAAAAIVVGPESQATSASERVVTVAKGVVQSTVSGSGNLSPANQTELSFGASGKVTKVYVKAGDHVTEGELLARIDPTSAEVDLAEAKATLSSAQDTLDDIESGTTTTTTASTSSTTSTTATPTAAAPAASPAPASTPTPSSTTTPSGTTTPRGSSTTPSTTTTPSGSGTAPST